MNLEIFNNLFKPTKENNIIQNFIKELGEFLQNTRNEQSLVQKILEGRTLTTKYRDKINVQRHELINNYSKENSEQGEFYYVYSKRTNNTYGLVSHKNGETGNNIAIEETKLPKGAGVDCVLRLENRKFILDKEATQEIQAKLTDMINSLLEEQNNTLKAKRIEGHIYEFVEKSGNTVWLNDETLNNGECFQEIIFPNELSQNAKKGDKFKFENGEYKEIY